MVSLTGIFKVALELDRSRGKGERESHGRKEPLVGMSGRGTMLIYYC